MEIEGDRKIDKRRDREELRDRDRKRNREEILLQY